ncbi:hypothetical protein [Bordetella avium]|uniref:hypothetical protein n=1 Tax=Bordetella avium TaxID=521 RepID=UPI000E0CB253|nr:hypothetical protein [Bordetella avium]RIQ13428.1 hypothetical protein D0432_09415 [Bordetella avium]RIQ36773.1 hypothetical protein D0848_14160 [Bordetella avium]RIQ40762.1 hypothetical protein D0847_12570 [Bordetella avium]RIQ42413.1 hypothetical protein D0846_12290 [Bordetella avium]RIQ48289.1 hypothetical protein D0845_11770 [Bordetella avium]
MQVFKQGWRRASIAALVAATLAISGCASTGSTMLGGTQLDPRLTQGNDAEFFSRSGFEACAGAAVAGVALCLLAAPSKQKATCAVVAGIAACGIAMGTNYYLDYRRSQYKTTGEMLDAVTQDVEKDTQKLQQRSQTLQAVIETDRQKIEQLRLDVAQGKLDQASARKQLRNVDADIARIKQEQDNIDNKIAAYREAAASTQDGSKKDLKKLDTQIEKLQAEAAKLRTAMGTLSTQRDSLDWGKIV